MMDTKSVRQSLLQDRAVMDAIRRRAHQLSLERGYSTPQHMADDWFRAENEVLEKLIEEEVKRRQKMSAAISEGAMAEEAVPAVTLPPDLAQRLAGHKPATRKPVARRKKADASPSDEASASVAATVAPPTNPALPSPAVAAPPAPASDAQRKPKPARKKAAEAAPAPPLAEAAALPPAKSKAAKSAKKKSS